LIEVNGTSQRDFQFVKMRAHRRRGFGLDTAVKFDPFFAEWRKNCSPAVRAAASRFDHSGAEATFQIFTIRHARGEGILLSARPASEIDPGLVNGPLEGEFFLDRGRPPPRSTLIVSLGAFISTVP
jgi:hypothetical protein